LSDLHHRVVDARTRIATACPVLHIGDVWSAVFGATEVEILDFVDLGPEWPWTGVLLRWPGGREEVIGAPAFLHATLVRRGSGKTWKPWKEPA
jgi:hypothetical protein